MRSKNRGKQFVKVLLIAFVVQIFACGLLFFFMYKTMPEGYNMDRIEKIQSDFDALRPKLRAISSTEFGTLVDGFIGERNILVYLTNPPQSENDAMAGNVIYKTNSRLCASSQEDVLAYWKNIGEDVYTTSCGENVYFTDENKEYTVAVVFYAEKENFVLTTCVKYVPYIFCIMLATSFICAFFFSLKKEIGHTNELEAQRSVFFSAAAHELKTPLSIVDGQLSGMLDGVSGYENHEIYLRKSLENVRRMEQTVKNIITVSRLQAGSTKALEESVNVDDVITELMNIYGDLFDQKNIVVDVNVERNLVLLMNHELVKDCIGALLSNACNYSPAGADVYVSGVKRGTMIEISVENTGVTIDEEHLQHLYEAFYRTDKSRNSNTGGSGLGLYLVKLVTENCGGSCKIENTENGVKSTIVLPEK